MTSGSGIDVSILIISYNTREMTLEAIASAIRETKAVSCEIIVVDNNSADGSAEAIAAAAPGVRLIALPENIGFGRANNLAGEMAAGEYILLLNPDTVVLPGAIDTLVAFARANKRALIWGGRTVFPDRSLNPYSCWRRMTPWNLFCRASGLTGLFPNTELFNGEAYGGWMREQIREVDIVAGCFFLMPRTVWTALGGFDPLFFMYGEEADLCLRARRIGARPLMTPDAVVVHYGGASEATRTDKMVKLLAGKASLIDRHWSVALRDVGLALLAFWPLSRWLVTAAAARLTGSPERQKSARTWREIWERRAEWRFGYTKPDLCASERAAQNPLLPRLRSLSQG